MLDSIPFMVIMGCFLGFLSGLGVGGGSLLILWLTLVLGIEHSIARNINLIFFIPSALISSLFRWKQGSLKIKKVFPAIVAGCVCAAVFSVVGQQLEASLIRRLFGFLLILTGFRELFYRSVNKKTRK